MYAVIECFQQRVYSIYGCIVHVLKPLLAQAPAAIYRLYHHWRPGPKTRRATVERKDIARENGNKVQVPTELPKLDAYGRRLK